MRTILLFVCLLTWLTVQAHDDFHGAQWIGAITQRDARIPQGRNFTGSKLKDPEVKAAWAAVDTLSERSIVIRKDVQLTGPIVQSTLKIAGLGFYELTMNGRRVGDQEMAPQWSDYDKTVYYNTFDVTELLQAPIFDRGSDLTTTHAQPNQSHLLIEVLLGNGFYNEQGRRYHKMKISFGPPTLLFHLHVIYQDGREEDIVSDESWQWAPSAITYNSIYGGEDYDARKEIQGTRDKGGATIWKPVVVQEAPHGVLRQQIAQPVKIMEYFAVKDTILYVPSPDTKHQAPILVLDMGQNLAGYPEITVSGLRGQRIKLTPGETLTKEGLVNQKQTGRPHYYTYTLAGDTENSGKPETWHPRFSYYSFRYLQVEGDIEVLKNIRSCFVYNSATKTGHFECSNPLFNDTYRLIDRAIRSNWQSVWTDCPAREKLGWLEQTWLNGEGLLANYDCRTMLEQTMQNICDAQYPNGKMPEIAPNLCVFEGSWAPPFLESPEWGGALIALPFLYRDFYGDDSLIKKYYPQMKRYVDYLATQDSCYILRQGLGDWYDYGPGRAGFSQNTPMPLVSTAHYYWWNHLLGENRADSIREAFNREFYHPDTHQYGTGSQCANAIALEMDLVPHGDRQAVLDNLIADIHAQGNRLTTGDVGNRYLFNALVHNGQEELLYKMLNHYDVPGYGYQILKGQTTLTEQWNPEHGASMNHFMMGHINNLLVPYVLGIWQQGGNISITPHPIGDLQWSRGEMNGIKASWTHKDGLFTLEVEIPEGQTAIVTMPYSGERKVVSGATSWRNSEQDTTR